MKVSSRLGEVQQAVNLLEAIRSSWSAATAYPGSREAWHPGNPAIGQGAVTALLLQELLGGAILYNREHQHFWNRLDDGREIDMTLERFEGRFESMPADKECDRDYLLNSQKSLEARTLERLQILKARVLERWTSLQ